MITSKVLSRHDKPSMESTNPTKSESSLQVIDKKIDQLIEEILPYSPYILRVQQSHGRRLPAPSQSYHWMKGTPFSLEEQELQYMTFRRPHDGMLHAHGQWDDGNGGIAPRDGTASQTSSGRTPFQNQSAKKKISFADYKNRDRSQTTNGSAPATQGEQEAESKLKNQGSIVTKDVRGDNINKVTGETHSLVKKKSQTGSQDEKRTTKDLTPPECSVPVDLHATRLAAHEIRKPADNMPLLPQAGLTQKNEALHPISQKEEAETVFPEPNNQAHPHPTLNGRAPESAVIESAVEAGNSVSSKIESSELPPLLSPTLPDLQSYRLPPLLSPNLPPEIEAAFAEAKDNRSKSVGGPKVVSRNIDSPGLTTRPKSGTKTSIGTVSSVMAIETSSPTPASTEPQCKASIISSTPSVHAAQEGHLKMPKKASLWVTLGVKKKNRRELSQYLRLKPTPTKMHWRHRSSEHRNLNEDLDTPASTIGKRERPRINHDDPRATAKRRRVSDYSAQQMKTPNLSSSSPLPTVSVGVPSFRLGALSSHPASGTVGRNGSGQGLAVTPLSRSRHSTPSIVERESPSRQLLRAECKTESTRLVNLARGLKYDSDKYLKLENATEEQRGLGLVIATESVICFILAAVVHDEPNRRERQPGYTARWGTILPLIQFLTDRFKSYQWIYGLLKQLEGVTRDTMHQYDLITLQSILRESEKADAPADQEAVQQRLKATLKESHENEMKALSSWGEGHSALWISDIQSAFPRTWRQARRYPGRGKAHDLVHLKDYSSDGFASPLGPLTSGLEAVNFGMSFLAEYCEKEGIQWVAKLVL